MSFSIHAQIVKSFIMQHKLKIAADGNGKCLVPSSEHAKDNMSPTASNIIPFKQTGTLNFILSII